MSRVGALGRMTGSGQPSADRAQHSARESACRLLGSLRPVTSLARMPGLSVYQSRSSRAALVVDSYADAIDGDTGKQDDRDAPELVHCRSVSLPVADERHLVSLRKDRNSPLMRP